MGGLGNKPSLRHAIRHAKRCFQAASIPPMRGAAGVLFRFVQQPILQGNQGFAVFKRAVGEHGADLRAGIKLGFY